MLVRMFAAGAVPGVVVALVVELVLQVIVLVVLFAGHSEEVKEASKAGAAGTEARRARVDLPLPLRSPPPPEQEGTQEAADRLRHSARFILFLFLMAFLIAGARTRGRRALDSVHAAPAPPRTSDGRGIGQAGHCPMQPHPAVLLCRLAADSAWPLPADPRAPREWRPRPLPPQSSNPRSLVLFIVVAAMGFSTVENVEYTMLNDLAGSPQPVLSKLGIALLRGEAPRAAPLLPADARAPFPAVLPLNARPRPPPRSARLVSHPLDLCRADGRETREAGVCGRSLVSSVHHGSRHPRARLL